MALLVDTSHPEEKQAEGEEVKLTPRPCRRTPTRDRPTPYQVWQEARGGGGGGGGGSGSGKHASNDRAEGRPPTRLSQKGWEDLLRHLNGADVAKKIKLMKQHHKNLADELRQLSFKPELNRNSVVMASQTLPLSARRTSIIKSHQDYISSRQEAGMKKMMDGCTFKPKLKARRLSKAYLDKAGIARRTVEDYFKYESDCRVRRLQRKQKMEELEGRELTFTPQLSRNSALIYEKLEKEGKLVADPITRQTMTRGKPPPTYTSQDPGHEEETFEPTIVSRSATFKRAGTSGGGSCSVYQRLYQSGIEKTVKQHNQQVATYRERFRNYPTRTYEIASVEQGDKAAWVEQVQRRKYDGLQRSDKAFLALSEEPCVHVIPYSTKYENLMKHLRPDFLAKAA